VSSQAGWRVSATFGPKTGTTDLQSITAVSGAEAWAAGVTASRGKQSALIEHWTGRSWKTLPLTGTAAPLRTYSFGLSVLAASSTSSNLWGFGTESGTRAAFAHFNGDRWTFGKLPAAKTGTAGKSAVLVIAAGLVASKTDVWAFGATLTTGGAVLPYAAQYNGRRWATRPVPGTGVAIGVAALSPRDILVLLGSDEYLGFGTSKPTVARWNGSRWRPLPKQPAVLPGLENATSLAVSGGHVWIAGDDTDGAVSGAPQFTDFAAELTPAGWHTADLPGASGTDYELASLVPDGHGGLWGLGSCLDSCINSKGGWISQRLWHFTGGHWSGPAAPKFGGVAGELQSLVAIPGTSTVWGAGFVRRNGSSAVGLIALAGPAPR
jgi:hypothetical protein